MSRSRGRIQFRIFFWGGSMGIQHQFVRLFLGLILGFTLGFSSTAFADAPIITAPLPSPSFISFPLSNPAPIPNASQIVRGIIVFAAEPSIYSLPVQNFVFSIDAMWEVADKTAPYAISLDTRNFDNGWHRLFAWNCDISGVCNGSEVDVYFDNPIDSLAPTIAIGSPLAGSLVSGLFNISLNATDDVSGVNYIQVVIKKTRDAYSAPSSTAKILVNKTINNSPSAINMNAVLSVDASSWGKGYYYIQAIAVDRTYKSSSANVIVQKK